MNSKYIFGLLLFVFCSTALAEEVTWAPGLRDSLKVSDFESAKHWWVDADAAEGGDGTIEKPFRSFEQLCGYMDGTNFIQGVAKGGHTIHLKGTFRGSLHKEGVRNMNIHLGRGAQGGHPKKPTLITSWPGVKKRPVLDGEHQLSELIHVRALGNPPSNGVVIENIDIFRANGTGILIGEYVTHAVVQNVGFRDCKSDNNGTRGALVFYAVDSRHDFTVRNCLFQGNIVDKPESGLNNLGEVNLVAEPSAKDGSILRVYNCKFSQAVIGLRHKHSGNVRTEAFYNHFQDVAKAFYIRSFDNHLHHNVVEHSDCAFSLEAENQNADTFARINNNTVLETEVLVETGNDRTKFNRGVDLSDNLYISTTASNNGVLSLAQWSNTFFDLKGLSSAHDLYHFPVDRPFLIHQGNALEFDAAMKLIADRGSMTAKVTFIDPKKANFHLPKGSIALKASSQGGYVGAFGSKDAVISLKAAD